MRYVFGAVILCLAMVSMAQAGDYYADPSVALGAGTGTLADPWNLKDALIKSAVDITPGSTLWLRGGVYVGTPRTATFCFNVTLQGTSTDPIYVKPYPGEKAVIDGGLALNAAPAPQYTEFYDLELIVGEMVADPAAWNSNSDGFADGANFVPAHPSGGILRDRATTSQSVKVINCIIHDSAYALHGSGTATTRGWDDVYYGNLIYNIGWKNAIDGTSAFWMTYGRHYARNAVYNKPWDDRTFSDNIMVPGFPGFTSAPVRDAREVLDQCHSFQEQVGGGPNDNLTLIGNIVYTETLIPKVGTVVLCSRQPGTPGNPVPAYASLNFRLEENSFYNVRVVLGSDDTGAFPNSGLTMTNNIQLNGARRLIPSWDGVSITNSPVIPDVDARPSGVSQKLRVNLYNANRANLAIYNWDYAAVVTIPTGGFLAANESYKLFDPKAFAGGVATVEGTADASGNMVINVGGAEFKAFVVISTDVIVNPSQAVSVGGGAIINEPLGRATLSVDVARDSGGVITKDTVKFARLRPRQLVISTGITSITIDSPTSVTIKGTCTLNGSAGFTYELQIVDNSPDSYTLVVKNGGGSVVVSASGSISTGNLTVL